MTNETFTLNNDQARAMEEIQAWWQGKASGLFHVLKGPAGTGKTFTAKSFLTTIKGRVVFTAPTNKATKVLRDTLTTKDYKPECCTIYSLLGLKMEANGEVKELSFGDVDKIDLSLYSLVVVDEASMLNSAVMAYVKQAAEAHNIPFLFMGDPFQLPPVGEAESPAWKIENPSQLDRVMRHDNQILKLATAIRKTVNHPAPNIKIASDNDDDQGVWSLTLKQLEGFVQDEALLGGFHAGTSKVIAWRNVTVDKWNRLIRSQLYQDANITPWFEGERVIFTSPAKDLDDETVATTDDEGVIQSVTEDWHPLYREFKTHRISIILDDNKLVIARVLHPECLSMFTQRSEQLAAEARLNGRKWRHFWEFKDSFHNLRHAYAITAHRSQGSTYEKAFVEYRDILLNRTRKEAFQCLYVACTRAKRELYLA